MRKRAIVERYLPADELVELTDHDSFKRNQGQIGAQVTNWLARSADRR